MTNMMDDDFARGNFIENQVREAARRQSANSWNIGRLTQVGDVGKIADQFLDSIDDTSGGG
jgi:hypothetical protein